MLAQFLTAVVIVSASAAAEADPAAPSVQSSQAPAAQAPAPAAPPLQAPSAASARALPVDAAAVVPSLPATEELVFQPVAPTSGRLGPNVPIASQRLGYTVNIRVYEPPATGTCESLPVLYVTDGSDYWKPELGNIVETLDELITTGRISPLIAVFIDAWDPVERRNRRYEQFLPAGTETPEPFDTCPFCDFIVEEVLPWVEVRYAVDAERRGILGSSLGGFNAAYMALMHPELFHVVGIQSPSIWRQPWFAERVARATALPHKVAIDIGDEESLFLPGARALRDAYASRGVPMQYREAAAGHSWKHWRATAGEVLLFLYPVR